ncbi:serine hydrolase domain-containing protein [Aneurinibacillus migulanus]|uniref:serine hydrolase domain-containing protein n=1 Tax=Aneurinibacillus migulanus TaxID=47500 RepID=UPI0020A0480A|nr:serine hydrolase domain-containing protein [Aneurinibacillus migulanus]MCP1357273.1 beta-lactamase family protein [Aneurinibacillus migulanus]
MKKKFFVLASFFLAFSFFPVSLLQHEQKSSIRLGETKAESFTPVTTGVKNENSLENKQLATDVDLYLQKQLALDKFHGTVLVAKGNTILLKKGYGYAYEKEKLPNEPSQKFAIASLTKAFTAMSILQLHERHALNINESIERFFPTYPFAKDVTIHDLLTHSSGLPMNRGTLAYEDLTLLYPPGTNQNYSNEGYILLGHIIEQASGMSYEDYLNTHIFAPLHMKDTGVNINQRKVLNRARGHKDIQGMWVALGMDYSTRFSSGSLYSTVEDLYKWDRALYTDKLVSEPLRQSMFTPQMKAYGYGWHLEEKDGRKLAEHNGYVLGFSAEIIRDMSSKSVIILLSNHGDAELKDIANTLLDIIQPVENSENKQKIEKKAVL